MQSFSEVAERLCCASAMLLGWRPQEFWSATPAELAASLPTQEGAGGPPDRDIVEDLIRRFPD